MIFALEFSLVGDIKALNLALIYFQHIFRAAGAFTNEREMHTTGKFYVRKPYYIVAVAL